ncbi:MAG: DUF4363 family protein [Clostridia bacterium]|nr:DUF4363 family protein [Clostridia bacterium]
MKAFIISVFAAIALTAGSILYTARLESCSDSLRAITDRIDAELSANDYTAAAHSVSVLSEKLRGAEPFIAAFGNHADIDLIESNLAELEVYAAGGVKQDAQAKTRVIRTLLQHLPSNTRIKIENIL